MIKLQFVAASGLLSRWIEWWGNGNGGWSHVDAVLPNGRLYGARSDEIGGVPPGVWDRPKDYDPTWLRVEQIWVPSTEKETQEWVELLYKDEGAKYDKRGIMRFIYGGKPRYDGMWFCSELQVDKLVKVKKIHSPGVEAGGVTPDLLHAICCSAGFHRKRIK